MLTRRLLFSVMLGMPCFSLLYGHLARAADFEFTLSDGEWRQRLTLAQYAVLRHANTERPFTSPLLKENRRGNFICAGCDLPLFPSSAKFESGTGWPSFWRTLPGAVGMQQDPSHGEAGMEVHCRRCGGHQGHLFDDGPQPTGQRYCINGLALKFVPLA